MERATDSNRFLVLTRRAGQSIRIGSDTQIFVVGVFGTIVRLEITIGPAHEHNGPHGSLVSCSLNQRIDLGCEISLSVSRIRSREVRLGISAPADLPILRTELLRRSRTHHVTGAPNPDSRELSSAAPD